MLEKLIVLTEEPSVEIALNLLLPRMLGDIEFEVHPFLCKTDLLKKLPSRLKGYKFWLPKTWVVLVLVDRDDEECRQLKQRLEKIAIRAGLTTKTTVGNDNRFQVVNRILVEELEAWFFGDWRAVRTAYPRVSEAIPRRAEYRNPDAIAGGTWEAIERILKRAGYFKGGLRKLELAREIVPHMDPERNTSRSFQAFRSAVTAAVAGIE